MASILVVEDDEDVRPLICAMLVKAGHTVRQAGNGVEGIKLYRESPADLVITDVVMPEKEGLGMIVELRRINPKVRIIAMSGGFAYDPKLYLHMATSLGADRVLRKPFQFHDLMEAMNAVLPAPPPAPAP
ncbi:MAG TPA: response regulator [Candidatus Didemnitutus sp.]|nr:response regulator [Candidatus Didemnitutus sp.]